MQLDSLRQLWGQTLGTPPMSEQFGLWSLHSCESLRVVPSTRGDATVPIEQCVRPSHLFEGFNGAALYDRHMKAKGAVLLEVYSEPIGQQEVA